MSRRRRRRPDVLQLGGVALVVGVVHFVNLWCLNAFRRRALLRLPIGVGVAPAVLGLLRGLDAGPELGAGGPAVLQIPGQPPGQARGLTGDRAELPPQGETHRTLK